MTNDAAIIAPSGLAHMTVDPAAIRAEVEARDKQMAGLRARAAMAGFSLFIIQATGGGSSFLVQRWGRSRELPDVAAVELFLHQAGAR